MTESAEVTNRNNATTCCNGKSSVEIPKSRYHVLMSETDRSETGEARDARECEWEARYGEECEISAEWVEIKIPGGCKVVGNLCADHVAILTELLD